MSNEKTSETDSWKIRLDQLELLPGTDGSFKDDAWEKLYLRLQAKREQPRKKRMYWYWTAAACLVLTGALYWLLLPPGERIQGEEKRLVRHPLVPAVPTDAMPSNALPSALSPAGAGKEALSPAATGKEVLTAKTAGSHTIPPIVNRQHLTNDQSLALNPHSPDRQAPGSYRLASPPGALTDGIPDPQHMIGDTILSARTTPLIAQQKLRVVHINELEGAVQGDPRMEQIAGRTFFKVRLPFNPLPFDGLIPEQTTASTDLKINPLVKISLKN